MRERSGGNKNSEVMTLNGKVILISKRKLYSLQCYHCLLGQIQFNPIFPLNTHMDLLSETHVK